MDYERRMPQHQHSMRVVIEGIGVVDIRRDLRTVDGKPRVRVDVISDYYRFGPAPDGLMYVVENADPGPGVVWITGHKASSGSEYECRNGSPTCTPDDPCVVCTDETPAV